MNAPTDPSTVLDPKPGAREIAKNFDTWADHPASSGFVPVHPDTLRHAARVLRELAPVDQQSQVRSGCAVRSTIQDDEASARCAALNMIAKRLLHEDRGLPPVKHTPPMPPVTEPRK